MSPSRVQAPPVNLKERIAALQQRTNASTSATSPSSSTTNAPSLIPVPSPTGHSTSNTNGNLREKIARFEKKGGVPVPRGSFGLGAPPPTDGHPRRQGELYGNRIPQPVRVVSGPAHAPGSGSGAQQRAQSPLGHGHAPLTGTGTGTGTGASGDKRRSFSLSNVNVMMSSDYSDGGGTPLTSPSLSSPPSSPGSASDTVALDGIPHIAAIPPPPSTFATALEFARSVEKAAHHDPVLTAASLSAAVGDDEHEQDRDQSPIVPVLPAIVVSQGEGDIVAEPTELPPVEEEEAEVSGTEGADEDATHAVAHDSPSTREDSPDQHPEPPSSTSPSVPPSIDLTIGIQADAPLDPSLSPSLSASVFDLNTAASSSPSPVPSPRKVLLRAAGLGSPPTDAVSEQPAPSIASELMLSDDESSSTGVSPVMAIALGSPASHSEGSTSLAQVAEEILQKKAEAAPEAEAEAEADRGAPEATAGLKSKKAPPPALALEMDGVTVPLSPAVDSDDAIPSSQLQRSTGDTSINTKEALKDIEQPEIRVEPSVAAVEEQQPSSPTTPHAPHAPLPIAQEPTPSHHPPSSPPSSLAPHSLNGTSIRPVSMIEFSPSPSHVQFAHRVTPSTSRGVPMFLPATDPVSANGLTRKSDLVYYPPTPPDKQLEFEIDEEDRHEVGNTQGVKTYREEEEEGEPGSVTIIHQRSNSATRQTSSSFRAVVHNKIREVPPILNHGPLVPQTPPIRRAASALPLNHGTPSLTTGVTHTYTTSGLPVIPPSPGFTELADLLQSTVLLEQTLEQGTLPTESSALNSGVPRIVNTAADDDGDISREILMRRADGVEVRRLSREEAEENRRTLAKLQAKREEQAKSKLRSTFRNTLARAKEVAGVGSGPGVTASMYIDGSGPAPQQQQEQQLYSKRFKSPSVPHLMDPATESGSSGVPNGFLRSKTPENQIGTAKPASLASKSPKTRFPSFRRLASSSKSSSGSKEGYGGGHGHTRNSVSTSSEISSEDSAPTAVTPPDLASEFGDGVKGGRAGDSGAGGLSWPSISPSKKGKDGLSGGNNSIARAATFAGKMWQRARTKSGGSTLSVHSTVGRMSSEPPPALPPLPNIVLPMDDSENKDVLIQPPARTTSLYPRSPQPPESPALPPIPPKSPDISLSLSFDLEDSRSSTPVQSVAHSNSLSPDSPSSLYAPHMRRRTDGAPPSSIGSIRPISWVSVSSTGSNLNSSLLDSELFDAFPSVPENYPLILPANSHNTHPYPHPQPRSAPSSSTSSPSMPFLPSPKRGGQGSGMMQPFDAALLSSAAHLSTGVTPVDNSAFLAPNSASSEGFLPLVSPYSPPESAQSMGGSMPLSYVNGNGLRSGVPPSR